MKLSHREKNPQQKATIAIRRSSLSEIATVPRKNWTKIVAGTLLVIAAALSSEGANWYVRPGSAGASNGADWNNAWSASGINWGSVSAGDTIWFAGGTYGGFSISKSGSSGNPIYIKRVRSTNSVPASAPGWSSAFDSTVTITSQVTGTGNGYFTIDGQIDYGIQFPLGNNVNGFWALPCSGTIQILHVKMTGPGWGDYCGYGILIYGSGGHLISHCYIDGIMQQVSINGWNGGAIEYSKFYNCGYGSPAGCHPDVLYSAGGNNNVMYRYNVVSNANAECLFFDNGGDNNMYFYGNTFDVGIGTAPAIETKQGYSWGAFNVYNNTFKGWQWGAVYLRGTSTANSLIYNNIFWNCANVFEAGVQRTLANNFYSGGSDGGAGSIGSGANPFVNVNSDDFHIVSGIAANLPRNKGQSLAAAFANDIDGNTRGADGAWDIGAHEYGTINTNPAISVAPSTLTFGAVLSGRSATNSFTVQNVGSGTLTGSASVSSGSASFSIISGQSYSLSAGQTAQVAVRYTPTTASDSGVVTFTGGGGAPASVSGQLQAVLSGLSFPAYTGAISPPFATNGGYISQTVDVSNSGQAGVTSGGQAIYAFNIASAGDYTISASVNAPNASSKSFWVNIDSLPSDPAMIWDNYPYTSGFETRTVSWRGTGSSTNDQYNPKVFTLSAGVHQLFIVGREAGVQLQQITIAPSTPKPPPPQNLRLVSGF